MWRITGSQYLGTIVASWVGRIIAAGFIGWSVITPLLAGQRPDPLNVAWMSLIAIMLWFSAGDAATHAKRARKMETYDLSQVIQPAIAATWDADLADTLDYANTLGNAKERTLIVVLDQKGLPYGLVDRHAAAGRLAESSARIPAGDVARPLAGWIGVPKGHHRPAPPRVPHPPSQSAVLPGHGRQHAHRRDRSAGVLRRASQPEPVCVRHTSPA